MAIPFLNHLDLRSVSELQNAILHKTTAAAASNAEGKIIYDTGSDTIKYYNGSSWISLTGDTNTFRTVQADGSSIGATETLNLIGGTNITLSESGGAITIDAGPATTVGKTSSSQRSGEIELIAGTNVTITEDGTTGHFTFAATDTNTNQLTRWYIRDDDNDDKIIAHNKYLKFTAATGAAGTNVTGTGTTSDPFVMAITLPNDNDNTQNTTTLSFVDSSDDIILRNTTGGAGSGNQDIKINAGSNITLTHTDANNITIASSDTNTDVLQSIADSSSSSEQFVTFVAAASGSQTGLSDAAFKYIPSTGTLKVTNLIVSGDTTTANETVKVVENNTLQFEGASGTAAANELNFTTAVLSADRTITLPDATGTVALTSDITGTNSGTNTGDEPAASTTVAGIIELATNTEANAGSATNRAVTPANLGAFTGTSNITTLGTIATGVWQGTAISTDYIANTSGTNTGDEPNSSTSVRGIVELATTTEASAGTDSARAVTPAGVKRFDDDRKHVSNVTDAIAAGATHTITHNLGTKDLIVQIYALVSDLTTSGTDIVDQYAEVKLDVIRATDNTITIAPNIAIRALAGGTLRVLIKALD